MAIGGTEMAIVVGEAVAAALELVVAVWLGRTLRTVRVELRRARRVVRDASDLVAELPPPGRHAARLEHGRHAASPRDHGSYAGPKPNGAEPRPDI